MKILVTGGAGYVGTTLIPKLLKRNYEVTVVDSLLFNNGDKIIPFIKNKNFTFVKADIRNYKLMNEILKDQDVIIHLAALVGYPICRERGETESHEINVLATKNIVNNLNNKQYLLFGSTGSNYGEVLEICTEETPLNPLSIYGRTKTEAEELVMSRENSTAFRFATAFGVSPRLRLDLLVNDLTYKAITQKYAIIYESHFLRTFIHVDDLTNSFLFAIDNMKKMKDNVYNVGSNSMNYTKKEICELIKNEIPDVFFHYADIGEDADKRNYQVSYEKINKLGFETSIKIEDGIKELIKCFALIQNDLKYTNV
jgi:nucleoside-diphosphate-sugar epimerase